MRLASLVLTGCLLAGSALTAQQPPPRDPKPAPPAAEPAPAAAESFEAVIGRLEAEAALTPDRPDGYYKLATFYEEKVRKDKSLPPAEKWTYVLQGLAATDRALAIAPDHVESLVFKGILLRHQANLVPDRDQQQALINEANVVRNRALELRKGMGVPGSIPVAPAEPAAAAECQMGTADGMAPVRVGGDIKAPAKVRDVRPVYPPEAQAEGVQGVVILQVLIAAKSSSRVS
jgi:hypothetical protein